MRKKKIVNEKENKRDILEGEIISLNEKLEEIVELKSELLGAAQKLNSFIDDLESGDEIDERDKTEALDRIYEIENLADDFFNGDAEEIESGLNLRIEELEEKVSELTNEIDELEEGAE